MNSDLFALKRRLKYAALTGKSQDKRGLEAKVPVSFLLSQGFERAGEFTFFRRKVIEEHSFIFNPKDNGGEAIILSTDFCDNGDEVAYTIQKLSLQCYGKEVEITVSDVFTPENLRQLANELDRARIQAETKLSQLDR